MFETTHQIQSGFRVATGLPFLDFQADLELKLGTFASAIQSSYLGTREPPLANLRSSSHWFLWKMLGISPKKAMANKNVGWWLANEWNGVCMYIYIYTLFSDKTHLVWEKKKNFPDRMGNPPTPPVDHTILSSEIDGILVRRMLDKSEMLSFPNKNGARKQKRIGIYLGCWWEM